MDFLILAKFGEIALKGLNKNYFENILIKNLKRKLFKYGELSFTCCGSIIYIKPNFNTDEFVRQSIINDVKNVFGISSINPAYIANKDMQDIYNLIYKSFSSVLSKVNTFKVETKRSDKKFSLTSPEISSQVGAYILQNFKNIKVDVNSPDVVLNVEIREKSAYVYVEKIKGAGGMPVSSSGRGVLLLSGGIDSPVAGYMMAKRGLDVISVHFESPPYTSKRAKNKVVSLHEIISNYTNNNKLIFVNLTEIQEHILKNCDKSLNTIIMRRYMIKISERIAKLNGAMSLITGESLAQVASQTTRAIHCTNNCSTIPIFRPLIGFDKVEIIEIAKKINTFETSILPYEDCCTVFSPKRPQTQPNLDKILKNEERLDEEILIQNALNSIEYL